MYVNKIKNNIFNSFVKIFVIMFLLIDFDSWFMRIIKNATCIYIFFYSQRSRRTLSKITILHINLFIAYILRASISLLRNYVLGREFVLSLNGHLETEADYTVSWWKRNSNKILGKKAITVTQLLFTKLLSRFKI